MTNNLNRKLVSSIGAGFLIIGLLLSLPQAPADAQASDGSYQLFGVNLVSTLPMMNKNGQSPTRGDLQTLDSGMYI